MKFPATPAVRHGERQGPARWLRGAFACLLLSHPAASGAAVIHSGQPLAEAIRALESEGLTVVFTNELVRPEMKVTVEPTSSQPRDRLAEILAPHGLGWRESQGVLVVVVAEAEPPVAFPGRVLDRDRGDPVDGTKVRVVELDEELEVATDGTFSLSVPASGTYHVEVSAPGFLEQRRPVTIRAGGVPFALEFRLQRQPFVHEEIVVRPSRLSLLLDQPNTSFALGREQIDSLPHLGDDLFRAAALFPGVTANDVSAQFSVHGGRRDEVRVVLDGQELYDAYHLKDYDNALSLISARTLADASLTTGSYPVSHGDRMSAVLDLQTVEPAAGRQLVLGLSVLDLLASSSGRSAGDRFGWLVTARRGSLDLAADAIGSESPRFWDVQAKLTAATERGSVSGHVLASKDELEVDSRNEDGFEVFENNYQNTYTWIRHQASIHPRLLVATTGSRAEIRRDRGGATLEEEGGFELSDERNLEVLSLAQSWTLVAGDRHTAQWGWEARRYDARFEYSKDLEPEFQVLAPFAPERAIVHAFEGTLRGDHVGIWASDRLSPGRRWTTEVGLRYDRHDLTDDSLWSPRVNLGWRQSDRTVVRAAWGVFHQTQRPYELQVEDGESLLAKAERSEHWLLGTESLLPPNPLHLEALRVELFRRQIDNPRVRFESLLEPLNFFPEIEPDRVRIDPSSARSQGIEVLLRGRTGHRLEWWVAYSRATVEDRLDGRAVPRALDQRHTITFDLNYRLGRWNLNAAWRYHSGWPTTPVEAMIVADPGEPGEPDDEAEPEDEPEGPHEVVPVFGALNSERLPDYHRLDLRASRSWRRPSGTWTFFVDVQNLYDRKNLAGFDVQLDEDEGTVTLEGEDWPGIFPSVGFTWTFGGARRGELESPSDVD